MVTTRNNRKGDCSGYHKELHRATTTRNCQMRQQSMRRRPTTQYHELARELNIRLCASLQKSGGFETIKGKLQITSEMAGYLKKEFFVRVGNIYTKAPTFLNHFPIISRVFITEKTSVQINTDSFQLRITKRKPVSYFASSSLILLPLSPRYSFFLGYKFNKDTKHLNQISTDNVL